MNVSSLSVCSPALLLLSFSAAYMVVQVYHRHWGTFFETALISAVLAMLLQALCARHLTVVAWIVVFVPFIYMSLVISLVAYSLIPFSASSSSASSGNLIYTSTRTPATPSTSSSATPSTSPSSVAPTMLSSDPSVSVY